MTNIDFNRREFFKVVSAAGTGLVLSFYLPSQAMDLFAEERPEPIAPNMWLKIEPSGTVTITVAKSEMGQGSHTYFPMIVAEELEADWKSIKVEQAPAHPDKYGSQSTGGSQGVRSSWDKLRKAGATAREMLIAAAAQKWNAPQSACFAREGKVFHRIRPGNKFVIHAHEETAQKTGQVTLGPLHLPVHTHGKRDQIVHISMHEQNVLDA